MVELYLHSPIRLHDIVLTFTLLYLLPARIHADTSQKTVTIFVVVYGYVAVAAAVPTINGH
jgi:hypothetical protein